MRTDEKATSVELFHHPHAALPRIIREGRLPHNMAGIEAVGMTAEVRSMALTDGRGTMHVLPSGYNMDQREVVGSPMRSLDIATGLCRRVRTEPAVVSSR
jgi:hypothetical protein